MASRSSPAGSTDARKAVAARAAADEVRPGMRVGLGTGSTVSHLIEALAERAKDGLDIEGVPTSERTAAHARRLGIPLVDLADPPRVDLAIDGADEIAPDLSAIKGLGGALTRERVVAEAADRFVLIADDGKLVDRLGALAPVPVEVLAFARERVQYLLADLGPRPRAVDGAPLLTDNGHEVIDLHVGVTFDPQQLAGRLDATPGVVDHGLFLGMADAAYVAGADGVRKIEK